MLLSAIPYKFTVRWGASAPGANIQNPIPTPSSGTPGRASFTDGYPPITFTPLNAGGIPPDGADENGILYVLSAWAQWQQAGAPLKWDSAFSAGIGGYPIGSIVADAGTLGYFWQSNVDGNTTNPDAGGAGWTRFQNTVLPQTGAQLVFTNATTLTLLPVGGGYLWVDGLNYAIPPALTISNGSLAANTLYYCYARASGGSLVLELATTGYTFAANGMPQKAGDPTRTLVGAAVTTGSSQFTSIDGALLVRSYFQRQMARSRTAFSADRSTSSSVFAELNSEIRNSVLVWAGEQVGFSTTGTFSQPSPNRTAATQISFDGGATELESTVLTPPEITGEGGLVMSLAMSGVKTGLSEGLHYATLFGASSAGPATWNSSNSVASAATTITLTVGQ